MIIYKYNDLKIIETRSDRPASDWMGCADHVVDERDPANAELIAKIKEYVPYFDYVEDEAGKLIDVVQTESPEPEPEPEREPTTDELMDALLGVTNNE